jgi:hypothetical protein
VKGRASRPVEWPLFPNSHLHICFFFIPLYCLKNKYICRGFFFSSLSCLKNKYNNRKR